jgi:hypothetical protein
MRCDAKAPPHHDATRGGDKSKLIGMESSSQFVVNAKLIGDCVGLLSLRIRRSHLRLALRIKLCDAHINAVNKRAIVW